MRVVRDRGGFRISERDAFMAMVDGCTTQADSMIRILMPKLS